MNPPKRRTSDGLCPCCRKSGLVAGPFKTSKSGEFVCRTPTCQVRYFVDPWVVGK